MTVSILPKASHLPYDNRQERCDSAEDMASSRKTLRLEISLPSSPGEDPVIINYRDVIEKKAKETTHHEGEVPSVDDADRQLCLPTAQQLRRKYRTWDFPDFRSLGCGYQEDSFIDNTETCDESVLSTTNVKYHIHSKSDSLTDSESDMELESSNESLKSVSERESNRNSQSIRKLKASKDPPEQIPSVILKRTKRTNKIVSTRAKPSAPQHRTMKMVSRGSSKFSKKNETNFLIQDLLSSSSKTNRETGGRHPIKAQVSKPVKPRKAEASSSGLPTFKASDLYGKSAPPTLGARSVSPLSEASTFTSEESSKHTLPDSSSSYQLLSTEGAAIRTQSPVLPDSVLTLLEIVTATDPAHKKSALHDTNSEVLLKLSEECRLLPASTRMLVYEQMAQHWDCAVASVSKRFGRIRSHMDEQPVKDSLQRLRSRLRSESTNEADSGGSIMHEITSLDSDLLRATLLAKARWLEKHPPRKESVRDAMQRFVDAEILPLWAAYGSFAHSSAAFVVGEEVRRLVSSGTSMETSAAHGVALAPLDCKSRKQKQEKR